MSFSAIADAANALSRLQEVFEAELMKPEDHAIVDPDLDVALRVMNASFTWDAPPPEDPAKSKKKGHHSRKEKDGSNGKSKRTAITPGGETKEQQDIFKLPPLSLEVPRGRLVAIVGPVGSGKTSLLQGLVGEMRRTSGTVEWGGSVAYCAQTAWIQNASIRENITFGRPFVAARYWAAVRASCLEADLDALPHGDMTEVGERGITLSGGQKQRVGVCRAVYAGAEIQVFDDPLSALDAHVGKRIFENVLLQGAPLPTTDEFDDPSDVGEVEEKDVGKEKAKPATRILVTHALHFLPQVDYIYTLVDGRVAEQGSYAELLAARGAFARFVEEFGAAEEKTDEREQEEDAIDDSSPESKALEDAARLAKEKEDEVDKQKQIKRRKAQSGEAIMQTEERNTGAISADVYKAYLQAGHGDVIVPLLVFSLVFIQGTTVMSSYWLVYWQEEKWREPIGFYVSLCVPSITIN